MLKKLCHLVMLSVSLTLVYVSVTGDIHGREIDLPFQVVITEHIADEKHDSLTGDILSVQP